MFRKRFTALVCRGIAAFFMVGAARGEVVLPASIKPVEQAPAGAINPHKPRVTRTTLKPAEAAAPLTFEVALKMRNFGELTARIARGEQISAQEMAARYEPFPADYNATAAWLTGKGFTIVRRGSMAIFARAKVSQIQQGLHVSFARVSLDGKEYTSAITAPAVPEALAPRLLGINGLQPHIRAHKHIITRNSLTGSASYLPAQIAAAYQATALYSASLKGSGQAIAIVIDTFPASSDLEAFWRAAGVAQSIGNIDFIQAVSGQLAQPSGEETLDTEWSSSMAPDVHVRVYAATDLENGDLDQAYAQVYDDVKNNPGLGIHQMSMSYGEGETYTSKAQVDTDDQYFVELAAAGVTIFASSGDDGSTPGAQGTGDESGPIQVETPASDPNVTGVGGTTLVLNSKNAVSSETVWNENGGASGGGYSEYFTRPSWQTGTGVATVNKRQVPDVAAAGDPQYGAVIVLQGSQQTVGGTSWSSPTWAAFCALLNQARISAGSAPIGILGRYIYPFLATPDYPTAYGTHFRDIITGNNATSGSGSNYPAHAGFDLCTGLGAPLVQPLAQYLSSGSALVSVNMPAPVESVEPTQSGTFTVTVTGTTATYQWQRMPIGSSTWANLANGGVYSGATGATVTISDVTTAMSGDQFRCVLKIGSSTVTTAPASVLVVDSPLTVSALAGTAGSVGSTNGQGTAALFNYPSGVAVDSLGDIYVADYGNNAIREITPAGAVTSPYGSIYGYSGASNGSGNNALFNTPNSVAADPSNNLYVADTGNNLIRKITAAGVVSTFAGSSGEFDTPEGVAVDKSGNVYVADTNNDIIWKITPGGAETVIGGQLGVAGFADGAATTVAEFNSTSGVAVDASGNVYVADTGNSAVRKIAGGKVTTIAGQGGEAGYLDGLGPNALFNAPLGVAIDGAGGLYIADSLVPSIGSSAAGNDVLRELSSTGVVSTVAGKVGTAGTDNGAGSAAEFYSLQAVGVSNSGVVYLADTYNQTIRKATGVTTKVITLPAVTTSTAGNVTGSSASLSGSANPEGSATTVYFQYGLTASYGSVTIGTSAGAGSAAVPFDATISGLTSDTTYHYRAVASSAAGLVYGADRTFTTLTAPLIGASPTISLNSTDIQAIESVNPHGLSTTVYFEYGTTASYGSRTAAQSIGSGDTAVNVSAEISGLTASTKYYFRLVATSAAGTYYGPAETDTTLAFAINLVIAAGDAAAGIAGAEFSAFGNPAINESDFVAFEAALVIGDGGVTASDNSGIWAANTSGALQLVARTGVAAPGTSALFSTLTAPVYNSSEAVAFVGALQVASGKATTATDTGVWSNINGSLALVARQGSQAPGFAKGATFEKFNAIALPDKGGVILLATVNPDSAAGVTAANNQGIWVGATAADLQLIIRTGDQYAGKTIGSISFLPTLQYVNGQTRSFAQSTGDFVFLVEFTNKNFGIFEVAGSALRSLTPAGDAAPGVTGGLFSTFGNPAINNNGDVAFAATLGTGHGGVTASDDSGIWADNAAGTLQLVARTGVAAPGTAGKFATLSDPVYNNNAKVAFRGTLEIAAGQAASTTAAGIWSNSTGTLALVARQGSQAPGFATGVTFATFSSVALADQGGVILLATVNSDAAAGVTTPNNTAIWAVDTSGKLQLIVRVGDIIGGKSVTTLSFLPPVTYAGGQTRNFAQGTGDIIFLATFSDKSSGIYEVVFP